MLLEPIAQALLFFGLSLLASGLVAVLARQGVSSLGVLVRAAIVFVVGLLLWLGWAELDLPAWGAVRIGAATWPFGALAVLTTLAASTVEVAAWKLRVVERRRRAEVPLSATAPSRAPR